MVKLRKNVEFYGSDEELTWKIPAVEKSVDELYEEKERKLYIYLEPVRIKTASKIIAKVRFPKYRTSSLS